MKCPKCASSLNKVVIKKRREYGGDVLKDAEVTGHIEVDQCLSCNGVWFDADELNHYMDEKLFLLDSPKVKEAKQHNKKIGDCPRCQKPMRPDVLPKHNTAVVDICDLCRGVWLDSGELDKFEQNNISRVEQWTLFFRALKERRQES